MIKKLWHKLTLNPKRKLIFAISTVVLVAVILLILFETGIFASELGVSNTATIYYNLNGVSGSAQSNTVITSVTTPPPSPSVSPSKSATPSSSPSSRGKSIKTPKGHQK